MFTLLQLRYLFYAYQWFLLDLLLFLHFVTFVSSRSVKSLDENDFKEMSLDTLLAPTIVLHFCFVLVGVTGANVFLDLHRINR